MNLWVRILLPFLGMLLGVHSQECRPPYRTWFNITNYDYIDALSSSCTTLVGTVMIATNFTGPFILPNITNITGNIILDWWDFKPTPNVTAIVLPDLQYLGRGIGVLNLAETLESVQFPKLEFIRSLSLLQYPDGASVNFSSLKTTERLRLEGNYTQVSLASLKNVSDLEICNTPFCGRSYGASPVGTAHAPMQISLPNLEVADEINIVGEISRVDIPRLSSAELTIHSDKNPVDYVFPAFKDATSSLDLQGRIKKLSLPRLEEVSRRLVIKSSYPLAVNLSVTDVRDISIEGDIESISLPNLTHYQTAHIDSSLPLDCKKFKENLVESAGEPHSEYWLSCDSTYKDSGRSTKQKLIIGIVVGVGGLAIVVAGVVFWMKKRGSKRKKIAGEGSMIELTEFPRGQGEQGHGHRQGHGEEGLDDPPPPYTADRG